MYRVINLKVGKVLRPHSYMHQVCGLRSIFFYSTMFDVSYVVFELQYRSGNGDGSSGSGIKINRFHAPTMYPHYICPFLKASQKKKRIQ